MKTGILLEVDERPLLTLTVDEYRDPEGCVVVEIMRAAYQLQNAVTVDDVIEVQKELQDLVDRVGELPV